MTDPDQMLARKAQSGDRRALGELYELHKNRVLGFLVKTCGDRQLAEDAYQEVWVKVMRAIGTYDSKRSSFRAWLYRIARNAVIDLTRREATRAAASLDAPAGHDGWPAIASARSSAPGPDRHSEGRAMIRDLQNALQELSERQRSAVLLRHQQGLTYTEIAATLDVPEGTAKTLVHRGVLSLREAMGEWVDA
jgi:RNA polymerase sigma-70 factor (ECF subfamily)